MIPCFGARAGLAVLALVALTLPAQPAAATILELDLFTPGDALVTRDTGSGLDWLDVTETGGLSYDEILAGAGGWADAGWRHATITELCGLFATIGGGPSPCPGFRYEFDDLGQPYLDYLGIVESSYDSPYLDGILDTETIWALYDDETANPWVGFLDLSVDTYTEAGGGGWVRTFVETQADWSDPSWVSYGHLLVRPVPEPGTGLLMAAGCALLALRRRRLHRIMP